MPSFRMAFLLNQKTEVQRTFCSSVEIIIAHIETRAIFAEIALSSENTFYI